MKAIVYSKNPCPYCVQAKMLLKKHNVEIEEINAVENKEELVAKVTEITGDAPRTVPQIFIDGEYIGGHDQLVKWFAARKSEGAAE